MRFLLFVLIALQGCALKPHYKKTVDHVDLNRFFDTWYVIAGRLTPLEKGAHNAIEKYNYDAENNKISVDFKFKKESFDGPIVDFPQNGWVLNKKTNAHWKIKPFFFVTFDYLIIDLADDYSWTAIGVPNQEFLWIMAKDWRMSKSDVQMIVKRLEEKGYYAGDLYYVPQKWD
jgi:apolipoprotein D and lipocalin family protein